MYFVDPPAGTAAGSPTGKRGRFQVVDTLTLYGIDDIAAPPFVFDVGQTGVEPENISQYFQTVHVGEARRRAFCPVLRRRWLYGGRSFSADRLSFKEVNTRRISTDGEQGRIRTDNLPLCYRTFFPKITSRPYPPHVIRRYFQQSDF